jgi:hypothetical protein
MSSNRSCLRLSRIEPKLEQGMIPLQIDDTFTPKIPSPTHRHIDIRHHYIREFVGNKVIDTVWISGKGNPADTSIKPLLHKPLPAFMDSIEVDTKSPFATSTTNPPTHTLLRPIRTQYRDGTLKSPTWSWEFLTPQSLAEIAAFVFHVGMQALSTQRLPFSTNHRYLQLAPYQHRIDTSSTSTRGLSNNTDIARSVDKRPIHQPYGIVGSQGLAYSSTA